MALAKNPKDRQPAKDKIRSRPNGDLPVWDASWQNVATERVDRHLSFKSVGSNSSGFLAVPAPEELPPAPTVEASGHGSPKQRFGGLATLVMAFDVALVGLLMAVGSAVFV